MKHPSLRARLVLLTTSAVAVIWLVTCVVTWRAALHEIEELLDHPPATRQHLNKDRRELAHEIAEHLLLPMLVALPGLAVVLVVAVGLALRPLRRLADDVGARGPERLSAIDTAGVPRETLPLVERLNTLFAGVERALANERRFTADAAHELRTPLAAIKAQAQVAQGASDDAERRHALQQIVAGCDRATRLVAQMLALARLDAGATREFHLLALRPLAAEVLADCAGEAVARGCELALADGDAQLKGDAELLRALLRNLVENALRHGAPRQVRVNIREADGSAVLAIADDGKGIPTAERAAVLQRFRRGAGADFSGSGLGLSIAYRIAELHGATLRLDEGIAGRGVEARLEFPRGA
jgi:two-component system sensor histidine kinase QseC